MPALQVIQGLNDVTYAKVFGTVLNIQWVLCWTPSRGAAHGSSLLAVHTLVRSSLIKGCHNLASYQ